MYRRKICDCCRKGFVPAFSNQRGHPDCRAQRRRQYLRRYHREYQRKVRRELKRSWEEIEGDAAGPGGRG